MAEGNVQLKLQASLDLAFLRAQVASLGKSLKADGVSVVATLNTKRLQKDVAKLSKEIRLKINDKALDATVDRIKAVEARLKDLQGAENKVVIGVTAKAAVTQKDARRVRSGVYRSIMENGGKILLPVGLQPISQAAVNAFKADLQKKLGSINVTVQPAAAGTTPSATPSRSPGFQAARESISNLNVEQLRRRAFSSLGSESRSAQQVANWLDTILEQGLKGPAKTKQLNAIRDFLAESLAQAAGRGAEARMEGGGQGPLGKSLDTFARGLFRMLGMDPAQVRAERQARLMPPAINWQAQVPRRNIPIGPSSTGRALTGAAPLTPIAGAPAPFGILPSITRRTANAQGVNAIMQGLSGGADDGAAGKLALTFEATRKRIDAILAEYFKVVEAQVRQEFGGAELRQGLRAFAYVAQALRDAEQRTKQARIDDAVASFLRSIENTVRLAEARATRFARVSDLGNTVRALPPARAQLMLPPGIGRAPELYRNYKPEPSWPWRAAFRTAQAYERSAARNTDFAPPIGALPPAGGSGGGRRGGGITPPGGFPSDGIQNPRSSIGLTAARIGELRRYAGLLNVARENTRNLSMSQLPLISGIRNLSGEFAEATKQVLLYGSAYKGLAFVASLPGNMLNAAKAQQQYNNGLRVATQETGTFSKELLFVDNVQRAFGLNLQTTREGFTRLYASMAPTGFDSGSIEKLFTGISAATAALQLTPDRAERVIYAFGQMASKGQVMSEELKGQLGDVLPGAVAIFAKAAGKSVQEFNKDLENGVYAGSRFRDLMSKVTDELIERFGTGAQAAGRSLQGLLSTVQGDFQRTLEALAPFTDAAAKAILMPLSRGLKSFSASAQIASGEMMRLEKQIGMAKQTAAEVRLGGGDESSIRAADQNVAALQARQEQLAAAMSDPAVMRQAKGIKEFSEEIATAGTFVMNFAKAIGSILSPILSFFGSNLASVLAAVISFYTGLQTARLAATVLLGALTLLRSAVSLLGMAGAAQKAVALRAAFTALGVSATGAQIKVISLRFALTALVASTVVGAVVAGIGLIAAAFMGMGNEAKAAAEKAKQAMDSVREAAYSGNVAMIEMQIAQSTADVAGLSAAGAALGNIKGPRQNIRGGGQTRANVPASAIPTALRAELGVLGVTVPESGTVNLDAIQSRIAEVKASAQQTLRTSQQQLPIAQRRQKAIGLNEPTPGPSAPEAPTDKELKTAQKKEEDAQKLADKIRALNERTANQQQQLVTATADHQSKLREIGFAKDQDLAEQRYEQLKGLIDAEYDYRLTRANEVQAVQLNLEKKLSEARLSSLRSVEMTELRLREARLKVENAQAKRAAAAQAAAIMPEAPQAALPPGAPAAPILPPVAGGVGGTRLSRLIGSVESYGGNYGAFNRGGSNQGHTAHGSGIDPNLVNMTIAEIQRRQLAPNVPRSQHLHAVGKYQIIGTTLRSLMQGRYGETGVTPSDRFTPEIQERLGYALARNRVQGRSVGQAMTGLRQEWIGLQNVRDADLRQAVVELQQGGGQWAAPSAPASGPVFSMQRREQDSEFGVEEAQAEEKALRQVELTRLQNDLLKDLRTTAIEVSDAIGQVLPLEQMTLENQLLEERNALMLQGAPEEFIQATERLTIAKAKSASLEAALNSQIEKANKDQGMLKKLLDDKVISQESYSLAIANSNNLIEEYKTGLAEIPDRLRAVTLETLNSAAAQLRNADALKAMQEAVGMVKSAVEGVMGSYKNFVGEVLKGGSLKDAAKRLQEALRDQAVTMFLDFAMKPMQKFLEDSLLKVFDLESEEQQRQKTLAKLQEQINLLSQIRDNTAKVSGPTSGMSEAGQSLGLASYVGSRAGGISELPQVQSALKMASQIPSQINSLPNTMEQASQALQGFQMKTALVTTALKQQSTDAGTSGTALQQNLGKTVSAIGLAAGAITSIAGGISQIKEGGISGVLGGIGSIFMGVGGALGGFNSMFPGVFAPKTAANGALWKGGFTPFANGGVVNGPTLGLVGEGKYNEAIVPLPDGRSIPVKMAGGQSAREAMSNGGMPSYAPSTVSFSFETTKINGVEYVSRDQLELAMASTRREAIKEGAKRGMSMTLDRIQQSPVTRRSIAMGRR